jgi:hypothetical protein
MIGSITCQRRVRLRTIGAPAGGDRRVRQRAAPARADVREHPAEPHPQPRRALRLGAHRGEVEDISGVIARTLSVLAMARRPGGGVPSRSAFAPIRWALRQVVNVG